MHCCQSYAVCNSVLVYTSLSKQNWNGAYRASQVCGNVWSLSREPCVR
jgi:hypothetical protein